MLLETAGQMYVVARKPSFSMFRPSVLHLKASMARERSCSFQTTGTGCVSAAPGLA